MDAAQGSKLFYIFIGSFVQLDEKYINFISDSFKYFKFTI